MHADPRLVVFLYIRLLSYAYFLKSLQSYNDYNLYPNFLAKKFHRHAKKSEKKSQNEERTAARQPPKGTLRCGGDFGGWAIKNHLRGVAKVIFY